MTEPTFDDYLETSRRREDPTRVSDLERGRDLRDEGAQAAELSLHTGWRLWAEAELDRLIESGDTFTADDLRAVCGDPPDGQHVNGIGGMFLRASKAGRIVCIGYKPSVRPEARCRPVRVWRGVPSADVKADAGQDGIAERTLKRARPKVATVETSGFPRSDQGLPL